MAPPTFLPLMLADRRPVGLAEAGWAYEPKYDGMRAELALGPGATVRLWSRDGHDKTGQFPDLVAAVRKLPARCRRGAVLDGEVVAVDAEGRSLGFPPLSPRLPLTDPRDIVAASRRQPAAFIAFDLLRLGDEDLRARPWVERRADLERLLAGCRSRSVKPAEHALDDGRALYERATAETGWEGVMAKRRDAVYLSGRRSPAWRKIKIRRTQTCVVGGWTEHRGSRTHSLLLGVYDAGALNYAGHAMVAVRSADEPLWRRLRARQTSRAPFVDPPADTRTPPHWVRPEVAVEVEHDGWVGRRFRHPTTFLGLREDVHAPTIHREAAGDGAGTRVSTWTPEPSTGLVRRRPAPPLARLARDLERLEDAGGAGELVFPDGFRLDVRGLDRPVWPALGITKGALMRYYVRVAPLLLPTLADRPLGAKYYPQGLRGRGFFQQRAPAEVPEGVRVQVLDIDIPVRRRIVGGPLLTTLFMVNAGVISQDPWLSRVGSLDCPDYSVFDLDPMPGTGFVEVVEVARALREALDRLGIEGFPKLSGASGLHVYVPLAPGTPYADSRILCEAVAAHVLERRTCLATMERAIALRGRKVYVDCLQNLRGKTLATAYSARAKGFAGVSAPVTWAELDAGIRPEDVTLGTVEDRLRRVGDLWAAFRSAPGVDPRAIAARSAYARAG
jgi:bifunctional non-homologous end joining protein LigD